MSGSSSASTLTSVPELDFDPDALRQKYREERDKRVRSDGLGQYVYIAGDFSHYVDDPYVEPGFRRVPLTDEMDVVVIGGGLAGVSAAARLRMAGVENIRVIEKGGDFGGAWYWNRYPGVQCDVESYIYIPMLEETGFIPSQKYAPGVEIFEQARRVGRKYGLYRDACFQTQVTELRWIEDEQKWLVTTNRQDQIKTRFVVKTNSPLDRPKLPGIAGIDRFKGRTFHTSRWDYEYTGGDTNGGLEKLRDKRVAIIGTGCTAVQCVPHLAAYAQRLYVVQRTATSVDERRNRPTDPEWVKTLTPGWQQRRRRNFLTITMGGHEDEDLVSDGWTETTRFLGGFFGGTNPDLSPEEMGRMMELADFKKMNMVRARVESIVKDKKTAEALKPWYRQFCKRPTFHDEYLQTFNRPNVTLIDTDGRGADEITETGIVFDGVEHPVDCIIFATGFETGTGWAQRSGCEIYGRGGRSLFEYWKDGLRTLHGMYTHGFPNLFHTGVTQGGASYNYTYGSDEQAEHIAEVVKRARRRDARRVEPTAEAEDEWVATIHRLGGASIEFFKECTPGYFNNEGSKENPVGIIGEAYGGGPGEFSELIRAWRAGDMEGLEIV